MTPRQIIISVVAFVLISVGGFALATDTIWTPSAPPAPVAAAQRTSVLILPFQMYGGTSDTAWIGDAVQQDLNANMARNPVLQVAGMINPTPTGDATTATQAARQAGAAIVVFGDCQISQGDVRVVGYLMDVPGNRVFSSIESTGPIANLFALEDQLDQQFNQAIGQQVPAAVLPANAPPAPVYAPPPTVEAGSYPAEEQYPAYDNYDNSQGYVANPYVSNGYPGYYPGYPVTGGFFINNGNGFQHHDFDHRHMGNTGGGVGSSGRHFGGGARVSSPAARAAAPQVHSATGGGGRASGGGGRRR